MGKKAMATPQAVPPAPSGLSEKSQALWAAAIESKQRWNAARLEVLEQGLRAVDRSDEARRVVDQAGLCTTTATTGAVHLHPAVKVEREFRQQALRALEMLGLLSLAGPCFPHDL